MKKMELSQSETLAVEAILAHLSERAKQPLSLEQLLYRWSHFVLQVERGYDYSIYDYINDLSVRDLLEEILVQVPSSLREKLAQQIRTWDERFYKATQETEKPLVHADGLSSWWFRVPKLPGDELRSDLIAKGYYA